MNNSVQDAKSLALFALACARAKHCDQRGRSRFGTWRCVKTRRVAISSSEGSEVVERWALAELCAEGGWVVGENAWLGGGEFEWRKE